MPCATGDEAFSLAILAHQNSMPYVKIDGRDWRQSMIENAVVCSYFLPEKRIQDLLPYIDAGYFKVDRNRKNRQNFYSVTVDQDIRQKCEFHVHDFLKQELREGYDVVYCLGLLKHLTNEGRGLTIYNLTLNMRKGDLLVVDKNFTIQSNTRGMRRADKDHLRWQQEFNNFVSELHSLDYGLNRISTPKHNVYEKV